MQFEDSEQKLSVNTKLVELARAENARPIITINDANMTDVPGKDSAGLLNECIFITVSGPNIQTWTVSDSYRREGSELIFEGPIESQHDILNLADGCRIRCRPDGQLGVSISADPHEHEMLIPTAQ